MKKNVCIFLIMTLFVSCMYEAMYFLTDKDLMIIHGGRMRALLPLWEIVLLNIQLSIMAR